MRAMPNDFTQLPQELPRPIDDGAAAHLAGMPTPSLALPATNGDSFRVDEVPAGFDRLVIYAYPMNS